MKYLETCVRLGVTAVWVVVALVATVTVGLLMAATFPIWMDYGRKDGLTL